MNDENNIIVEDQIKNPNCTYSSSFSKTCSTNNETGKFMCETIKNIQRICPEKSPITIYSQKSQYDTNSEEMENIIPMPSIRMPFFGSIFNDHGSNTDTIFRPESLFESFFGSNDISRDESTKKKSYQSKPRHNQFENNLSSPENKLKGSISGSVEDV